MRRRRRVATLWNSRACGEHVLSRSLFLSFSLSPPPFLSLSLARVFFSFFFLRVDGRVEIRSIDRSEPRTRVFPDLRIHRSSTVEEPGVKWIPQNGPEWGSSEERTPPPFKRRRTTMTADFVSSFLLIYLLELAPHSILSLLHAFREHTVKIPRTAGETEKELFPLLKTKRTDPVTDLL